MRLVPALKKSLRRAINKLGYDVASFANVTKVADDLSHCRSMREIHSRNATEIEDLYRQFVFPGLPRREARVGALNELIGTSIGEAIYIVHHLSEALRCPGDVCEFGVAQGATSRLIANEILTLSERKLWLFDSFEGLPEPSSKDKLINDIFRLGSMSAYKGSMASPETQVRSKLASIDFPESRIKLKKGWIKDTINTSDLPNQVAFAYVDLDFYDPIRDALHFLDGRMPSGGRIVVDDYGWFSEGAQIAVDEFIDHAQGRFKFELPLPCAGHFCILSKVKTEYAK
jgi:O-methyltransferase